jgi:hypothetical protein
MSKMVLDMAAMQEDFFSDTAMIGMVTAMPGYRLCWMLNQHFNINFARDPGQNIMLKKKDNEYCFPTYQYGLPNSSYKYVLYKLKNGSETLLPETKQLDYLWLIQTATPEEDALYLARELRNIADIQLAQILASDQLKSVMNLLV